MLAALAAGAYLKFTYWLDEPLPVVQPELVLIERGSGVAGIADKLSEAGLGPDWLLQAGIHYLGLGPRMKAGEYRLESAETRRAVFAKIAEGRVYLRRFTVPEGRSSADILRLLEQAEAVGGPLPASLREGSLLPETYLYQYGDRRSDIVARMHEAQAELLARLWAERDPALPYKTPEEAVIMASIVEAETPKAEERARVAGVFINRLRRGMKLQTDPTVIYGITQGARPLDRAISRADLSQATPWNTYVIDGLPPTPINHPGRASLIAALKPEANRFLYFVADGTGGHLFAESYEQHQKNVAAYRAQLGR